jgi:hypothetical protein
MTNFDNQLYQFKNRLIKDLKISEQNSDKVASLIAEEIRKNKSTLITKMEEVTPIEIKTRLEELSSFQEMMDTFNKMVPRPEIVRSQVITQNYVCFVYLKDTLFEVLKQNAENGSTLKKCTKFLLDNPVRAFRNSIAHGNWKYKDDFSGLEFWARKGIGTNEPMTKFEVSQDELNFWQTLSRCLGYTSYLTLEEK